MANLHFDSLLTYFLSFLAIVNLSSSTRTFENPVRNRHHSHHKLSFLMRDVFDSTSRSSTSKFPANTKTTTNQLPFSKPLGFFLPRGGIPIPEVYTTTTTTSPTTGISAQTPDLSTIGISFPVRAILQELEYGIVREIDEELFKTSSRKPHVVVGRIKGLYVENNGNSGEPMIAMRVYLGNGEIKDGLKMFGVYKSNHVKESHITIIGGMGKYLGANGYATLKKSFRTKLGANYNKFMELNVYLSK
ncbi:dirigent protein 9-like [Cucurbita moschata]|uniref:Dirigent protein n=1 Tax=Cucurbita moschata TaxID=3662 RepID=A0A6J1GYQ5_CUCMO|nr:dirigent protein 9-like [Cucurbita moschata]